MSGSSETGGFGDEVAVVGMSGRFPGAGGVSEFWRKLRDGAELISFFTDEELLAAGVSPSVLRDPHYVKAAGVLDGIELFDAAFFGFSPREAETMDPQHRIFLECAWEALEDAGYDAERCQDSIGLYAGMGMSLYLFSNLAAHRSRAGSVLDTRIGNDKDFLTTRVSYKLNLKGPSIDVQTACSTSLVAVHLACQSLLNHECGIALAGGVSVTVPHIAGYFYQEGGIASPDGHCRAFDSEARGTVGGSGAGIVVLKRLADAVADGDQIHGVIKGTAINNDGSVKVGYTAPSINGQAEVISEALSMAGLDPEAISYIETHGTGTALGDPVEIEALTHVFRAATARKNFCAIGSVKTNIGHLDVAAGVAGLIKTLLMLKHRMIAPSLHFKKPNPKLDLAGSPFYVNTSLAEWKAGGGPRRCGVSSFGVGGTNAHVVVEEAPAVEPSGESRPHQLLVLSAKTGTALDAATGRLARYFDEHPETDLADVAFTLQVGRKAFDHRRFVVCRDRAEAAEALKKPDAARVFTGRTESSAPPVFFMFPGQGAQHVQMGAELYRGEPTFRRHLDDCSEILERHMRLDLRQILYPAPGRGEEFSRQLNQTAVAQPALFAVEYALAQLWGSWGIRPQAMIGHSLGEYVAACLAGVLSLEDALALVAARGRLMQTLRPGTMLAVPLPEPEAEKLLRDHPEVSLAAVNASSVCVASGAAEAVDELQRQLEEKGINCRRLHTSHAFHSPLVEPILERFYALLERVRLARPRLPFVSNVSGRWITAEEATSPAYWVKHLRQTVRFHDGLAELLKEEGGVLLEVGPGQTLCALARQHTARSAGTAVLSSLPRAAERQSDAAAAVITALGRLWLTGVEVDWAGFYSRERRLRVSLPTYPFERERFWLDAPPPAAEAARPSNLLNKRPDVGDWFYVPSWRRSLAPRKRLRSESGGAAPAWLVFDDGGDLSTRLIDELKREGARVVAVEAGGRFEQKTDERFTINPRLRGDYESLFGALKARAAVPEKILHLWGAASDGDAPPPPQGLDSFAESQHRGFYSLLYVAQALERQGVHQRLQIGVVTSGLHEVSGGEPLSPDKATVLAACKVIPQEYPNLACCNIDLDGREPAADRRRGSLPSRLIAELEAFSSETNVIAYRGGHRWVQTFEHVPPGVEACGGVRLREGGVYLITGGLGRIGMLFAEHLARKLRAKLVLVGREAFPARGEWEQWLRTHGEQEQTSRRIRRLQKCEDFGAEVLTLAADAADEGQMRAAVARAREGFGGIHGVIHAAGAVGEKWFGLIRDADESSCERQFRPKAQGVLALARALEGVELDFCLLMSSLSTVLGGVGLASYSAANLFMDAFALRMRQREGAASNWVSASWDGWRFGEEEASGGRGAGLAELAITPEEGVEALERLLSLEDAPHVVVSTGDLAARVRQWIKLEALRAGRAGGENGAGKDASSQAPTPPRAKGEPAGHADEVEQKVADIFGELLGVGRAGPLDDFFELGGHSLLALQLISRVRAAFQVQLQVSDLVESPSVAGMARRIREAAKAEGATEPDSPLVEIQNAGSGTPFFCVHPAGGLVAPYVALAKRLGPDQPFYALKAQPPAAAQNCYTSVEEMAALYLGALRVRQPEGPYLLGGWSFGAVVAFEMAQQLTRRGEEVALLALFDDGPAYHSLYDPEYFAGLDDAATLIHLFRNQLTIPVDELRGLEPGARVARVLEEATAAGLVPGGVGVGEFRNFVMLNKAHAEARFRYGLKPYPGRVTLFRAGEELQNGSSEDLGWGQLAPGRVEVHVVPGSHLTMLVGGANVEALAEALRACINRARAADSSPSGEGGAQHTGAKPLVAPSGNGRGRALPPPPVMKTGGRSDTEMTSPWLDRRETNANAKLRLFCFPYAGGGGLAFRNWGREFPSGVEVCAVCPPGRERRVHEPPFTKLPELVRATAEALLPHFDRPFAFFGHSMGALLGFELARLLRREYGVRPAHLFVSGRSAPQIPRHLPVTYNLPEPEFIEELRRLNGTPQQVLEHPELMRLMVPILRADFEVVQTYAYTDDAPLACSITAFGGLQDPEVPREALEAWREQTTASYQLRLFPGDHFFIHTAQALFLRALSQQLEILTGNVSPPAGEGLAS